MRFNCGEKLSVEDKVWKAKQWKRWFAWRPVRLTDKSECVWLEFVERRYPRAWEGGATFYKENPIYIESLRIMIDII